MTVNLLDDTPAGRAAYAQAAERRRQRVRGAVNRGDRYPWNFDAEALAELFSPEQVEELKTQAAEALTAQVEARRARGVRAAIEAEADKILSEWDAQRREEARGEARRRLGLSDAGA